MLNIKNGGQFDRRFNQVVFGFSSSQFFRWKYLILF